MVPGNYLICKMTLCVERSSKISVRLHEVCHIRAKTGKYLNDTDSVEQHEFKMISRGVNNSSV